MPRASHGYEIGSVVGKRTVIGFVRGYRGRTECVVRCECGSETTALPREVRKSERCNACARRRYYLGQRKGTHTIIALRTKESDFMIVRCDCGRETKRRLPFEYPCACQNGSVVVTVAGKGYRVRDIASVLGVTKDRARQLLTNRERLIERLRGALA